MPPLQTRGERLSCGRELSVHAEQIQYFNRYTGQVETEEVYGEAFMRCTYGTLLGKFALHGVAKRALFSHWYGWRMNRPASAKRVLPFVRHYGLNAAEFAEAPESFTTFNEFFSLRCRQLTGWARPAAWDSAPLPPEERRLTVKPAQPVRRALPKNRSQLSVHPIADRARLQY